ncbi:MAG: hypothetical protein ACAH80_18705 [Alphaproteobacteria bacterium]
MTVGKPSPFLCLFPGCVHERRRKAFFCYSHWSQVPYVTQRKIVTVNDTVGRKEALLLIPAAVDGIDRALKSKGSYAWNHRKQADAAEGAE